MFQRIKLALLYGGKSGEHEVSLISAASVLAHLDPERYEVTPVALDKEGRLQLHLYEDLVKYKDSLPVITKSSKSLDSLMSGGAFFKEVDVVFPVVHGPMYEDGCLQGLLELSDVAYVGTHVLASAVGMDKDIARRLLRLEGIKATPYRLLSCYATEAERQAFMDSVISAFSFPLFVKPCCLGSSVGIHKVATRKDLQEAIADALRYDESILVEAFIKGREIEVAVLENIHPAQAPKASVPGEIVVHHPDGFYSYAAKYLESTQSELLIPAPLSEKERESVQDTAIRIFKSLKCKGMARVDFFFNEAEQCFYFNEINTLPGFTPISMYPKLMEASGLPYDKLLDELIALALLHKKTKNHLVTSYL